MRIKSIPGEYHGFWWFFFINEQLLRFLNLRYPRDYDTVPPVLFWLFNLIWLFPWSVYLPGAFRLSYRPTDRSGKTRLMALCLIAFVMVFFTFSTTQEYYSMPIYSGVALLIGAAMARESRCLRIGNAALTVVCAVAASPRFPFWSLCATLPRPGDISQALSYNPSAYKLSLGHMEDLTLNSFAYLRLPLALAAVAFLIGVVGTLRDFSKECVLRHRADDGCLLPCRRMAMVTFDPYLSSRPMVNALERSPQGDLIIDHHYFWYSSVFFYTDRTAPAAQRPVLRMVYGSYAPTSRRSIH